MESYRNVSLMTGLPFNIPPIQDITDTLPSRTPDPEPRRTPDQITHVSVHHSAVEGASIQSYANYHVYNQGWAHIGYHLVIKDGVPYQTNDLMTFSYHTSSHNYNTVSVSISGDLSKRPLSEPERNALYAVILTYMELFNIPVENVLGHREYPDNNTSCPCIDMSKVRDDVRTIQNQMKYKKTPDNGKVVAYKIANQILYLYRLAQGKNADDTPADPGNIAWATQMLLKMEPFMEENKLFG